MGTGVSATPHSQEGHPNGRGLHVCRPFPVGFFKNADSHVAPPSDLGTAVGASDNALIGRMGRDGESIAATLAAPEGGSVRVRLDRLRHDTASILVGRPTGEEWLNGASLFLKRPLSSNFAFLLAKLHTGVFCMTRKRKVDPALERQFWIAFAAVTGLGVRIVLLDAYLRGTL